MSYAVLLRPAAARQLRRLRGASFIALRGVVLALSDEPRPRGATKLVGTQDGWRLRVRVDGRPWRVVYTIDDSLQNELRALADACAGTSPYPLSPEEARRNVAVVEAIRTSAEAGGTWVRVAA